VPMVMCQRSGMRPATKGLGMGARQLLVDAHGRGGEGKICGLRQPAMPVGSLVSCLETVIATWRYDIGGKIISLDVPRHLDKSPSRAGRGFKNSIFANFPP
jgi:hypothetical protein